MVTEAQGKKLVLAYERVSPDNEKQIEDASFCEREGFGSGLDPQELPAVLRFIARYGTIWLQYLLEDGKKNPTGVVEFIPLEKALTFDPSRFKEDLSSSPFKIIMGSQKRIFRDVRRFAPDKDIIYHHGIAMASRGKGYGTLLLRYALEHTNSIIFCPIDSANLDKDSGKLQLAPNEASYLLHLKAGFVLVGVLDPPVYDEALTHYSFIRPRKIKWANVGGGKEFWLNIADGSAKKVLKDIRKYTAMGYLGVSYSKETHEIHFVLSWP